MRHGACSHEGCTNNALKGGVCSSHGAKKKICSHEGCTSYAQKGGVCVRHGANRTKKICSHEGCANIVQKGGVCWTHGANRPIKIKTCSIEGCTSNVKKGGLCYRHRDKSNCDRSNAVSDSSKESPASTTDTAASNLDQTPVPMPSLCISNDAYDKDTDDEDEVLRNYKTEEQPIKKEYDEAYEQDTDDESGVEKVPV